MPIPRSVRTGVVQRSVSGVAGHAGLFSVCAATTTFLRVHPQLLVAACVAMAAVLAFRLGVARAYARAPSEGLYRLFRIGTIASAALWGVGAASLIVAGVFE